MTNYDIAVALKRLVDSSNINWHSAGVFTDRPELRREIASLLAYTVQNADVTFTHATVDGDSARVVMFTNQTVVIVDGAEDATATVVPRSALRAIRFDQVPDLIGDSWPRADELRVSLGYRAAFASDLTVALGHPAQTAENARAMVDFLADLQGDLLR